MRDCLSAMCFCAVFGCILHGDNYPSRFEGGFSGWEHKRLDLVAQFLPANPVILQAGGHYGTETIRLAQRWPKGRVFALEPNPHAFEILCANIGLMPNVQLFELALGESSGVFPFYICHGSTGDNTAFEHASSLLRPSQAMAVHYQGPCIDVACCTLSQWCDQNHLDHLDLMCLDLQGAELQVLKGSPQVLRDLRGLIVHTNFFPFREGTTQYSELRTFLDRNGFHLVAHWYRDGLDGEAIFLKEDLLYDANVKEFLDNHQIDETYGRYHEPFFDTYYDLEHETDDSLKKTLKQGYAYEGNIGIIIQQLTRSGSVAIDVGAHIGIHTVTMSRKAGPQGAVIAFEPNRKLYMELLNTMEINHCSNVMSMAKALGDVPKTEFLCGDGYFIDQGVVPRGPGHFIETMTLDSLCLENVSLMKIDIEGYEFFALKGAAETIARSMPVIIFECWTERDYYSGPAWKRENFDRVVALLESYGYEVYNIYCNDWIAFPREEKGGNELSEYRKQFRKLDIKAFDIGLN